MNFKKWISKLFVMLLSLAIIIIPFVLTAVPVKADGYTVSVSGPSTVRAGNTITLTVKASGGNLLNIYGSLTYDTSVLSYYSSSGSPSGWKMSVSNSNGTITFFGEDENQTKPIKKSTSLFTVTFKVSSSAETGKSISVTPSKSTYGSDGNQSIYASVSSYSVNVAAPLSKNCSLSSLSLSSNEGEISLSPAFNKDTLNYTCTVPFSVEEVSVKAKCANSEASYTAKGTKALWVGVNDIVVTVTAESGDQKVYTISLTREQDPNYVPSDNANLSSISISQGILSPAFDPDITEYCVYLPFEVDILSVKTSPEDPKAKGAESIDEYPLELGDNSIEIINFAENGTSTKSYYIEIIRMPQFTGTTAETTETTTESETSETTEETTLEPPEETTETTTEATTAATTEASTTGSSQNTGTSETTNGDYGKSIFESEKLPLWMVIAMGLLCLLVGFGTAFLIFKIKDKQQ